MIDSRELYLDYSRSFMFSVCTFVTKKNEYELMKNSFLKNGFTINETEFLYFDNSKNSTNTDAFEGINYFLKQSKGKYIIICHQDIEVIDSKDKLLLEIDKINLLDKNSVIHLVVHIFYSASFSKKNIKIYFKSFLLTKK